MKLIFISLSLGKMHNDSLLELIETFTPSEKNSFKRYISYTGGGRVLKYEELYNIYNKHLNQGYDKVTFEKKVKGALKKKPQLSKDLNNIRKRLKDKLLESLSIQGSSNSNIDEITNGINEVRILIERKLYHAALQKIKQLKNKAKNFNLNKYIIELIEMEISVIEKNSRKNDLISLQSLSELLENYLYLYSVELRLKNIFIKIKTIVEMDLQLRKKKHTSYLKELHNKLDFIQISEFVNNKQVYIVLWYYRIKSLYSRLVAKTDSAFTYGQQLVNFFESDKAILKNFQKEYVKAICSFSRTCFHLDKNIELNHILAKARNIFEGQKNFNALEATCEMAVLHYLNTFQFKNADAIANLMDENWQYLRRETMDGKLLWYAHTNSILYWTLNDRHKLELWANRGLDIQRPHKGKVYFFSIRMLMLMHDYDTKELLHFNEKVQALQKTMSNNEGLKSFEKIVLKYIKKLASIEISTQRKKEKANLTETLFKEFKTALLGLHKEQPNFVSPINYDEILTWCESHLQNKTIRELFEVDVVSTMLKSKIQ